MVTLDGKEFLGDGCWQVNATATDGQSTRSGPILIELPGSATDADLLAIVSQTYGLE